MIFFRFAFSFHAALSFRSTPLPNTTFPDKNRLVSKSAVPVCANVFKVLQSGQYLSELLQLNPVVLAEIVYDSDLMTREVKLEFEKEEVLGTNGAPTAARVQLFQNQPNPFADRTTITFVLPEACEAELRVLDVSGRLLQSYRAEYAAGTHSVLFEMKDATASGLLYYELITPYGKLSKKMVLSTN